MFLFDARREIDNHLVAIAAAFPPGAKITLLVQHPDFAGADLLFSNDAEGGGALRARLDELQAVEITL